MVMVATGEVQPPGYAAFKLVSSYVVGGFGDYSARAAYGDECRTAASFPQFYAVGTVDIIQTVTVAEIYPFGQVQYVVPYGVDASGGVLYQVAVGIVFVCYFHLQARPVSEPSSMGASAASTTLRGRPLR